MKSVISQMKDILNWNIVTIQGQVKTPTMMIYTWIKILSWIRINDHASIHIYDRRSAQWAK